MAQTVAVVRNTLSATSGGTTDFTKSGFGTPTAAIIISCNANTTSNPQDSANFSVGFWDGSSQRAAAFLSTDNVADSDTRRSSNDSYGVLHPGPGDGTDNAWAVSAVTDGIRLTLSVDNTGAVRYCTVILFAGVSAKTLTFTPNTAQNSTTESASLGHAPTLIFFTTVGATVADQVATAIAVLSFGFAASDGTHRMIAFGSADGASAEQATLQYSETRCVGQAVSDVLTWAGEVTTFGSDTFTMTTRDGGSGSDVCFALSLGGADLSFDCGTLTTPTSTGDDVVSTDVDPDAVLLMLSTATGTTLHTDSGANGLMCGIADANGQYSHSVCVEDAAATTNSASIASATAVVNLDSSSGGSRTNMCDATVTLNSSDFTLNYSAVDATARKGWWVAFGAAAAPGGSIVGPLIGGRHLIGGPLIGGRLAA